MIFKVSKSFGFEAPPFVDLPVSNRPKLEKKAKIRAMIGGKQINKGADSNGPASERPMKRQAQEVK